MCFHMSYCLEVLGRFGGKGSLHSGVKRLFCQFQFYFFKGGKTFFLRGLKISSIWDTKHLLTDAARSTDFCAEI